MDRMEQFESVCSENEGKSLKDYSSECAIEWLRGDKVVTVTFPGGTAECNRIKEYAQKYPEDVKISHLNTDGSIVARVSKKYIRISRPKALSEEQKAASTERFRKWRESQKWTASLTETG